MHSKTHNFTLMMTVCICTLLLTGCPEEFRNGYQFGDISRFTIREFRRLKKPERIIAA